MSEPKKECYECLNYQRCPSVVEYESIYCHFNRKFEMKNVDYSKEKDKQINETFFNMLTVESKIKSLEKQYNEELDKNSIKAFILKCKLEGFKEFEKELKE